MRRQVEAATAAAAAAASSQLLHHESARLLAEENTAAAWAALDQPQREPARLKGTLVQANVARSLTESWRVPP